MKSLTIFLVTLFFFVSCNKKDVPHLTHHPKSYLPAYPGSYWKYDNGGTINTSVDFELGSLYLPVRSNNGVPDLDSCAFIETGNYVKYNGNYLKGYTTYKPSTTGNCASHTLLSETLGDIITVYYSKFYSVYMEVTAVDTVIVLPNGVIYDSVIVMKGQTTGGPPFEEDLFYAKHVGYIGKLTYFRYPSTDSTIRWNEYLVDYYINN